MTWDPSADWVPLSTWDDEGTTRRVGKKIGRRSVVVIRKTKIDRLSDEVDVPPEHTITGCAIVPRASFEEGQGWVTVEGWMVIAPFGSDVTADDNVRLDADVWQVDGAPGHYENRRGKGKATIFYLKKRG